MADTGTAKKKRATQKPKECSIPVLAAGVGVSTRTIDKYLARGCPRTSVDAVMKWRSENIRAVSEDADPSEIMLEIKRAEAADKAESARTRQIKNDVLEGKLIWKEDAARDASIAYARASNKLASLGMVLANLVPSELKVPVKDAVENRVSLILKELADELRTED